MLTPKMLDYFMDLCCALSPENLHCDGEISRAEANRKHTQLMREWRAGERIVGHPVYEHDVWRQYTQSSQRSD